MQYSQRLIHIAFVRRNTAVSGLTDLPDDRLNRLLCQQKLYRTWNHHTSCYVAQAEHVPQQETLLTIETSIFVDNGFNKPCNFVTHSCLLFKMAILPRIQICSCRDILNSAGTLTTSNSLQFLFLTKDRFQGFPCQPLHHHEHDQTPQMKQAMQNKMSNVVLYSKPIAFDSDITVS